MSRSRFSKKDKSLRRSGNPEKKSKKVTAKNAKSTRKSVKFTKSTIFNIPNPYAIPKKVTESSRRRKPQIPTKQLLEPPKGSNPYKGNTKFASYEELTAFVYDKIEYGPQIVSIPVLPYRHAFLIDVQNDKIMVSDWGGEENRKLYNIDKKNYYGWKQYSDLMDMLEEKYKPRLIEYYHVDEEIQKKSGKHNIVCDGGGCSHYIYEWTKKYYPGYSS